MNEFKKSFNGKSSNESYKPVINPLSDRMVSSMENRQGSV
jgi:hypothetical protein